MTMTLYVGPDSTWSLRVCLALKLAKIDYQTQVMPLSGAEFKQQLKAISQTGLVPALKTQQVELHDSLAIAEYINELSNGVLYPQAQTQRAQARSLVAEMHSGFFALRTTFPFGPKLAKTPELSDLIIKELQRVTHIFSGANGRFYFGQASLVDCFYAILAKRLADHQIWLKGTAGDYQNALLTWDLLTAVLSDNQDWQQQV